MPQTFQVLRCYKCFVFQVHQTKKTNKWECKLCGEKQSIKRHYGIGIAKDCRIHVQKLNNMRGEIDELKCGQMSKTSSLEECDVEELETHEMAQAPLQLRPVNSKWSNYLDVEAPVQETSNESMYFGDAEVVLEIPKKRRKQLSSYRRSLHNTIPSVPAVDQNVYHDTHINDKSHVHNSVRYNSQEQDSTNNLNVEGTRAPILLENRMEKEISKPNIKKFVPPVVNKHSKWAGFIEDKDPEILSTSLDVPQNEQIVTLYSNSKLNTMTNLSVENTKASTINVPLQNTTKNEDSKQNLFHKQFVPPLINKQSKWTGFVEDEDTKISSSSLHVPQIGHIFSLCDDSELDSVLNII